MDANAWVFVVRRVGQRVVVADVTKETVLADVADPRVLSDYVALFRALVPSMIAVAAAQVLSRPTLVTPIPSVRGLGRRMVSLEDD
jgi:hypothetical protein